MASGTMRRTEGSTLVNMPPALWSARSLSSSDSSVLDMGPLGPVATFMICCVRSGGWEDGWSEDDRVFFLRSGQGLNFHSRIAVSGDGAPEDRATWGAARASGGDRATKTRGERRIASVPRVVEPRSPRERARLPRTAAAEKRILGISSARTPSALVCHRTSGRWGDPGGRYRRLDAFPPGGFSAR